ncbi:MAG TPA: exosortase/archaeosortase family protein [Myxococcota bacterium]|nr:exosortase/archaeosortase family protein [Myxococcota bacterium]
MKYPGVIREAAIAGGVGALFVASPLTGDELGRAALAGFGVAAAVFAFRNRAGLPREPEVIAHAPIGSAVRALPWALWLALPLWVLVFWPTLQWLWKHWTSSIWTNDHGVFMPPIIALLTYFTLRDDPDEESAHSAWGFVWLVVALALALTDAALRSGYLGALALIASLPGLSLLLLGTRRTRRLAVPLALGLLMVPVPAAIATNVGLRHLTASSVEPLLQLVGYSAFRDGTVIQLAGGTHTFIVADECSGIATLYAGVAVATVLACYARSHAKRLALLAAVLPLAIGANVVRVLALILMSSGLGHWIMESPIHPLTGVATFAIVVGGLLVVAGRDPLGTLA